MWWQTTDFVRYASVSFGLTFKGAWLAFEAPGVELAFPDPNGKQDAIDYARGRFGGSRGEIHVLTATTVQRSSVASSSTVAASIRKSVVTEKIHPRHSDFHS